MKRDQRPAGPGATRHQPRLILGALLLAAAALFAGCTREARMERILQRANAHLAAGELESARIEFQNVLQLDPQHARAHERLGHLWLERGAPLRALPHLLSARQRDPDDRDVHLRLLQIALASGKLDEARKGALALLQRAPGNVDALILLTETIRSAEDFNAAKQAVRGFPNRSDAGFYLASANLALHEGNPTTARAALQRALTLEPKSPAVHLALAAFHFSQHDAAQAAAAFKSAASVAPARSAARLRALESLLQSGATAEAIAGYEALTREAPDFLPAWRGLAEIAMARKKFDDASRHLDAIFRHDPGNFEGRLVRAQLWIAREEPAKAVDELLRLTKDFPGLAAPKHALARLHLREREPGKAMAALQAAIQQNPDDEQAVLLLATLQLRSGDPQSVVVSMVDLLGRRPGVQQAQLLLIDGLGALGRVDEIIRLARAGIAAAPEHSRSHFLLGLGLARQGHAAEARASFAKALELAPDSLPVVAELVRLDLKERAFPAALARVEEHLVRDADSAPLHLLAARVHLAAGRAAEAEAAALRALQLSPGNRAAYDVLGRVFATAQPRAATLARMERWLEALAGDAAAQAMAGNVYLETGDAARARDAYEKHLALEPDSVGVLNNLAFLCAERLDQPERALELARRARELEPFSPEIADTLGWILFKRHDYSGAWELLKESAARRPDRPEIQFHLGRAGQMIGETEIARAAFVRAAQASVDFPGKSEIPRHLAQLESR